MSRMGCVEGIYDVLVGAGLRADHACFDDLIIGCVDAAVDPVKRGKEVVEIIADLDEERTELEVAMDIKDYFRECKCERKVCEVLAEAVDAGKAGMAA